MLAIYIQSILILTLILVNGRWGSWTSWSSCSATCGGGQKIRQRFCNNPSPSWGGSNCSGSSSQQQTCDTKDCPGKMKAI